MADGLSGEFFLVAVATAVGVGLLAAAHVGHRRMCRRLGKTPQPLPHLIIAAFAALFVAALAMEFGYV